MGKKLVLTFVTSAGNRTSLSLDDPKDELEEAGVRTAMQNIIDADVFEKTSGEGLSAIKGAKVVETAENVLIG